MSKLSVLRGLLASLLLVAVRRLSGRRLRAGWSFAFEVFADALKRADRDVRRLPLAEQSAEWERRALPNPLQKRVRIAPVDAGGVPAEWVVPNALDRDSPVMLYLHGGWYSSASPRNYRELISRIAVAAGVRVLVLDYRLAPAHPFPAAIADTLKAWRWLLGTGVVPARVVVAGDSAGGGLTTGLLLSLRDTGDPLPACAALICPWIDLTASGGSLVANEPFDWSDREEVDKRVRLYVGSEDPKAPLVSPVFADLHGLPPLLVQAGGAEMLLDQIVRFAERARAAGTPVTLRIAPDMIHDWHMFAALFPQARAAIDEIAAFVRANIANRPA